MILIVLLLINLPAY
ncbi:hypothetical protein ACH4MR_16370 [Escherichia marmotae]